MDSRASGTVVDPRASLAMWLRTGRTQKNLSLEDVARITKIQPRILEKLETGNLEGLPADVFVKGFVRSFAKCVGLDEREALDRLGAAQTGQATLVARAFVESMSVRLVPPAGMPSALAAAPGPTSIEIIDVAPLASTVRAVASSPAIEIPSSSIEIALDSVGSSPAIDIVDVIDVAPLAASAATETPKKKRASRKKTPSTGPSTAPRSRKKKTAVVDAVAVDATSVAVSDAVVTETLGATVAVFAETAIESPSIVIEAAVPAVRRSEYSELQRSGSEERSIVIVHALTSDVDGSDDDDAVLETQQLAEGSDRISQSQLAVVMSDMLSADSTDASGSWQPTMPPLTSSVPWRRPQLPQQTSYVVPHLVIDDADPDSADRQREREERASREHSRLSFLPPILLDREDRSARQGGLTLAVIILLIAATLTLSYLMRRPSARGDGVTLLDGQSELLG